MKGINKMKTRTNLKSSSRRHLILETLRGDRDTLPRVKPTDNASEAILVLKPVPFRYKKEIDPAGASQFGLVAEEVGKGESSPVVQPDKQGKPSSRALRSSERGAAQRVL